jgi:hypothetical protein
VEYSGLQFAGSLIGGAGIGLYTFAKVGLDTPIYFIVAGLFVAGIAWLGFRISEKMAMPLPSFVFPMAFSLYLPD